MQGSLNTHMKKISALVEAGWLFDSNWRHRNDLLVE
jgi:hypothetical protein